MVINSVDEIIRNGRVVRPALGIYFAPKDSAQQLGVKGVREAENVQRLLTMADKCLLISVGMNRKWKCLLV